MRKLVFFTFVCFILLAGAFIVKSMAQPALVQEPVKPPNEYWMLLHRKSNREFLYKGVPGEIAKSTLIKRFQVKTGIPGEKPTPLPQLVGRDYWLITDKLESADNPETAPYFLVLDVPVPSEEPYGPAPYKECDGQCNWEVPGYFGLHGVAGDMEKLSLQDPGSSGCVRHADEDITYLYNILEPSEYEIRYYVRDV